MAKAKPKTKAKPKGKAKKRGGQKKKNSFKKQLFLVLGLIMAGVFSASTVLLVVGMLPTFVAGFVDRSKKKNKAFTVGSMNLAGCTPFLLELWSQGHTMDKAVMIISDPTAIVVIYAAAAVGYLIDWAMTGLVSTILYDRGKARQRAIEKKQKELIERWGKEITGTMKLDEHGFAIEDKKDEEKII